MALSLRLAGLRCLLKSNTTTAIRRSNVSTKKLTAYEEMNQYWVKNKNLNRPLSPHLTVFKPHLTMTISITNRILAVALQVGLVGASVALVFSPGDFKTYFDKVRDFKVNPVIIYSAKAILAFPFAFHLMAGLRHLMWDAGMGFGKQATYQGGWVVLATTLAFTSLLVFGVKPSAM